MAARKNAVPSRVTLKDDVLELGTKLVNGIQVRRSVVVSMRQGSVGIDARVSTVATPPIGADIWSRGAGGGSTSNKTTASERAVVCGLARSRPSTWKCSA